MSIKVYISNKIEDLAYQFSENNRNINDVFSTELIITKTEGIDRWLALETTKNNHIFSNYKFEKIHGLIEDLCSMARIRKDSQLYSSYLKWTIYNLLNEEEFKNEFPLVAAYYHGDELKRFQLSVKTADLFNQYMIYRQDYIQAWNKNEHAQISDNESKQEDFEKSEAWQFFLWRRIKSNEESKGLDIYELKEELLKKLKDTEFQARVKKRYPRISIFNVPVIYDFHLEIIQELSRSIDINLYLTNPSPQNKWYEEINGQYTQNKLIEDFAHVGSNLFSKLYKKPEFIKETIDCSLGQNADDKLIHILQNDIFNNAIDDRNILKESHLKDNSLQIASSYTEVREVEALYNYLVEQFNNDKDLLPKDILVQISNVDKYAAYIKAIFDNGPIRLPYSINDRTYSGSDSVVSAVSNLLNLREEDFTSETVVRLLDSEFIRNKFGITDLAFIRELVANSNIHFGVDGSDENDTRFVSWKYGLERMLLGYTINGGEEYDMGEYTTFPLDTFEGSQAYEMLRFKAFVDTLIDVIQKRGENKNLSEWNEYILTEVIERLIHVEDDSNDDFKHIINKLSTKSKEQEEKEISYEVFKTSFSGALSEEKRTGKLINGRICFCSLQSMHGIPFKIKAMLGLDSGNFPGRKADLGFDLISMSHRAGDEILKNNDRYLFLETILSTREKLYLSYLGTSSKDNSELQPSLFIDELLDYIQSGAGELEAEDIIKVEHPLYTFSKKYLEGNPKLVSYLNDDEKQEKEIKGEMKKPDLPDFRHVNIKDIITFCKDPFKWYYNKTLQIYYNIDSELLSETELFSLDNLEEYQVKMLLLDVEDRAKFINKGKKTGLLPLANMAEIAVDKAEKMISNIRDQYKELKDNNPKEKISIDFRIDEETRIFGTIEPLYGDKHICINVSRESGMSKYLIDAWIKHLCLIINEEDVDTYFVANYKDEPMILNRDIVSRDMAIKKMQEIVAFYKMAHDHIIAFSPAIGFKNLKKDKGQFDIKTMDVSKQKRMFDDLRQEGQTAFGRDYYNEYIKKEIEQGFFKTNKGLRKYEEEDIFTLTRALYGTLFEKVL